MDTRKPSLESEGRVTFLENLTGSYSKIPKKKIYKNYRKYEGPMKLKYPKHRPALSDKNIDKVNSNFVDYNSDNKNDNNTDDEDGEGESIITESQDEFNSMKCYVDLDIKNDNYNDKGNVHECNSNDKDNNDNENSNNKNEDVPYLNIPEFGTTWPSLCEYDHLNLNSNSNSSSYDSFSSISAFKNINIYDNNESVTEIETLFVDDKKNNNKMIDSSYVNINFINNTNKENDIVNNNDDNNDPYFKIPAFGTTWPSLCENNQNSIPNSENSLSSISIFETFNTTIIPPRFRINTNATNHENNVNNVNDYDSNIESLMSLIKWD